MEILKNKTKLKIIPKQINIDLERNTFEFKNHLNRLNKIKNSKIVIHKSQNKFKKIKNKNIISNVDSNQKIAFKINEINKSKDIKENYWNLKKFVSYKKTNLRKKIIEQNIKNENKKILNKLNEINANSKYKFIRNRTNSKN